MKHHPLCACATCRADELKRRPGPYTHEDIIHIAAHQDGSPMDQDWYSYASAPITQDFLEWAKGKVRVRDDIDSLRITVWQNNQLSTDLYPEEKKT